MEIAVCSPCLLFNLHPSIFTLPFTDSEWIATDFALAMAKGGVFRAQAARNWLSCSFHPPILNLPFFKLSLMIHHFMLVRRLKST
jgi:hypothetical protein